MKTRKRERIYIVFHWTGLAFGLTVFLIFAAGFLAPGARSLTQTLGITLVIAGVVALIQSNENLRGVAITGCRVVPAVAGEDAVLELTVRNFADRERIGLRLRTAWRVRPFASTWLPVLEAGEVKTVRLPIPTTRRGRFAVPILWVSSVMPFGLCFAWKSFPGWGEYFVYPAPRGRPLESAQELDSVHGRRQERGHDDVSGHRPYSPGDLLSRMDWRVFARSGKLMVRTLEEGGGEEITLRWTDTYFLKGIEERLEQLSFWITQCLQEGRPFQLQLGGSHPPLSGNNADACWRALATFAEKS